MAEAVKTDTQIFIDQKIATSIEIDLAIPGLNRLSIVLMINADERKHKIEFEMVWKRDIEANA